MTYEQAMWAESHDWHIHTYNDGTKDNPSYAVVVRDDDYQDREKAFTNFEELRRWVGRLGY